MGKTAKEIKEGGPVLYEYIRDPKTNRKIGVIIAIGAEKVGWSVCKKPRRKLISVNERIVYTGFFRRTANTVITQVWQNIDGDKFDIDTAFAKAFKRANVDSKFRVPPRSISSKYGEMMERSRRYFKTDAKA